jgi:hypothetical protein
MENVPQGIPDVVREYLYRQLAYLESKFLTKDLLPRLDVLPNKPVVGQLYYFNRVIAPSITVEGVWVYKSTGWAFLG